MRPTKDIEKRIKNVNIIIDAQSNKRVFSNILQAFQKSTAKDLAPTGLNIQRIIFKSPITKLAAAVIILAISMFIVYQGPSEQAETTTVSKVTKSPVEMMTAISLTTAYRKGGIEAVEEQCKQVYKPIGPRPRSLSIEQILTEFNGNSKSSERKKQ